MRISIWQQFSSNHSANYTVVGEFTSPDYARAVGDKIRQIIREIVDWSVLNPGKWGSNPIEKKYASEYAVDWKEPIDWLQPYPRFFREPFQLEPEEHIVVADRLVFVDVDGDITWQTGHQFSNMLAVLGGQVFVEVFAGVDSDTGGQIVQDLECDVICSAPSTDIAEEIDRQIQAHLQEKKRAATLSEVSLPIPWIKFHPHYTQYTENLPEREAEHKWKFVDDLSINDSATCTLSDAQVTLDGLAVFNDIGTVLPALIGWMQSLGCTVNYEFRQGKRIEVDH